MFEALNHNAGAISGVTTTALLLVTMFYTWTTFRLLSEAKLSRLIAGEPRVVAYLRANEVHHNIAQLQIANLSEAAAIDVSACIDRITAWPEDFYLQGSKVLRDLSFMRPHEVIKFDIGVGPDLFRDNTGAEFKIRISFSSLDSRKFEFVSVLRVESVAGHSLFKIHGIDDVARSISKISETLQAYTGFKRVQVDLYGGEDRRVEMEARNERRRTEDR